MKDLRYRRNLHKHPNASDRMGQFQRKPFTGFKQKSSGADYRSSSPEVFFKGKVF